MEARDHGLIFIYEYELCHSGFASLLNLLFLCLVLSKKPDDEANVWGRKIMIRLFNAYLRKYTFVYVFVAGNQGIR